MRKGPTLRVLLIEDEPTAAKAIERMLAAEGFTVCSTDLGDEGLVLGKAYAHDIILLDLNLPDTHGFEILKALRASMVHTPIVVLSGNSDADTIVESFSLGADDFVTKPFDHKVLVARIHAVARRSKGHSGSVIRTGRLTVNLDSKTVEVDGVRVRPTAMEYELLELLSLQKGTTLSKEILLIQLYGRMAVPDSKIIDVFICKLRKKLSHALGGANYIETVRGRGYVMRDPEENGQAAAPLHFG